MLDLQALQQKLKDATRENAGVVIADKCFKDYPYRENKTLRRIARSCAAVEVGSSTYNNYFSSNNHVPAGWNEKGIVTVGFSPKMPELGPERRYLKLKNSLGHPFYITWEDL